MFLGGVSGDHDTAGSKAWTVVVNICHCDYQSCCGAQRLGAAVDGLQLYIIETPESLCRELFAQQERGRAHFP